MRTPIIFLFILSLMLPSLCCADNDLTVLESAASATAQTQPGLMNYHARVETSRIKELMTQLTKGIPEDVQPPPTPIIYKFWQRDGKGLVYADKTGLTPYVEKIVKQVSGSLAVELNEMLLPVKNKGLRQQLASQAQVKTSTVALADNLIHRLEIIFDEPRDLTEAFYVTGMRLPQKQVKVLSFDVDTRMNTVNEMHIVADNALQLTVEIRYIEVDGGYIPERFKVTSPDGTIDDLFEVSFTNVEGYVLPASMTRTIRRPDLQEDLEVAFKDYQVNRAVPADILNRLKEE